MIKMENNEVFVEGYNTFTEVTGRQLDPSYNPKRMEENKMGTLRDEAQAYQPPQTLNIADLDKNE